MGQKQLKFEATTSTGEVSALLDNSPDVTCLLVLGHGAGAGMRHPFMESLSNALVSNSIATFRYQFPYIEHGRKAPDPQPILLKTVRSAVAAAAESAGGLPVFAGGKSLGGRMTSTAAATEPLAGIRGIVFFGFPLHAPGKPSSHRAEHLNKLDLPLLFLQGTRDKLADLTLFRPVWDSLVARAAVHILEGADHGFHVPKRSGRTDQGIVEEVAEISARWMRHIIKAG